MNRSGRMAWRAASTAAITAFALFITACSGSGPGPEQSDDTSAGPVAGGELIHRVINDIYCLDPAQNRERGSIGVIRQVVDSLTYQRDDGTIEAWLAESWDTNEDATQYTFHLRDGVTFSDGSPLTAEVVADNIQSLYDLGALAINVAPDLREFESVEVIDELTLQVNFASPQAQFIQTVSTPETGILSAATLALDPSERCTTGIIGTGPFTIEEYVSNESLTLARHEGYAWAPPSFQNQGEAYLDTVKVMIVPDASVAAGMLISGQVDSAYAVAAEDHQRVIDAGLELSTVPQAGVANSFYINPDRGLLQDPAVRFALLRGLDRDTYVPTVFPFETPATDVLTATTPGYSDHSDLLAFDPDAAASALDAAGWTIGPDGVREKDGVRLSIPLMYFIPAQLQRVPFLELAKQGYAEIGIEVVLDPVTAPQMVEKLQTGDWDLRFSYRSKADPSVLGEGFAGLDPALDALLAEQASIADPAERAAATAEATAMILDKAFIVPVLDPIPGFAWAPVVHGIVFDNTNTESFSNTWIEQ